VNFYNDNDPFAAAWLRELIKAGHIAPGIIDERSIVEINPDEIKEYTQCHFFAGIGVWSYALRQAGWSDDRPVWTGSCPCPSFSAAGKGKGFSDTRHLWPAWFRLIRECRPATIFGEQVSAAIGYGWLDLVQIDLETQNYAIGKAVLGACSVGAPHIRQRLWFVANSADARYNDSWKHRRRPSSLSARPQQHGDAGIMAVTGRTGLSKRGGNGRVQPDTLGPQQGKAIVGGGNSGNSGFWSKLQYIPCRDGKCRPIEPGTFPLAHGTPNRVGRLRGYGNALCAPIAEAFIRSFMEVEN
jgi:DNA (cytosine-5)-methyltransferase 1